MTLNEAIEHLDETLGDSSRMWNCEECRQEHIQLRKWLIELKGLREVQEPHVVTIADYKNNPNVDKDGNLAVWQESRHFNGVAYHEDGWIVLNRDRVEGWFNSKVIRFWTSRPDEKRRAETPWN